VPCFCNYVLCFFFYKIREQEGGTGSTLGEGWHQWKGGDGGERGRRVNMVQIMNTDVCKCKMIPVETVPGIRREGDERVVEGVNSSMMYLIQCQKLCKCYSVPPPSITIIIKNFKNYIID
jgi:hypothetical protein